jgi:GxxExxY protein
MTGRDPLTDSVIAGAIEVHRALGPGLLESVYEECLACELHSRGILFERQKQVPLVYKGRSLKSEQRIDLLVAGCLVVELKSVERLLPFYDAQLLTYLRLTGATVGLLLNFNVPLLKDGIRRLVLNHNDSASLRLCGEERD